MKSMAMSALLAALLAGTVAMPAGAAEGDVDMNAGQNAQQNRSHWGTAEGDSRRRDVRPFQRGVRTGRGQEATGPADGGDSAVQTDRESNTAEPRHFGRGSNEVPRYGRGERNDSRRHFGYHGAYQRFADRGQQHAFGRHGTDSRPGYRGNDHRFAYRGQGHAFGRHGTDRRFWGHGASQRFGAHAGHPRFGDQWGHGSAGSRVNRMQAQQHRQIVRGVRSGELTRHEARRLQGEQRMIRRQERAYLADGRLSRGERRDLYQAQRSAQRHIYNQTHDAQKRR